MVTFSGSNCVMEVVREEHPRVEVFPATDSGYLRLSPHGLWDGVGIYESAVFDLGEIYVFSGVGWQSIEDFSTTIDTDTSLPKEIEVRYHDYQPPITTAGGGPWIDGEVPHPQDPGWSTSGIPWNSYENDVLVSGVAVRYIQWRATLRGA